MATDVEQRVQCLALRDGQQVSLFACSCCAARYYTDQFS